MEMIKEYLKTKISEITIIVSIFSLNALIMYLTNVRFEEYTYVILLFIFFYAIYLFFSYINYKNRYREICNLNENNLNEITGIDIIEKEYLRKIDELYFINNKFHNERLEELDRLEEDYSIWIHQAKTPISALSLIVDSVDIPEKEDMKQELFKINQYTEMALANIRLQDINKDLEIKEHDLYTVVKNTVKKYALYFNYQKNTLNLEKFDRKIVTDEKWFAYSLDQVISNAVKYTKNGDIKVYVSKELPNYRRQRYRHKKRGYSKVIYKGLYWIYRKSRQEGNGLGIIYV